jgi:hypothetical protein
VYSASVHNVETLHQNIMIVCQTICIYDGIFELAQQSIISGAQSCINSHEGHNYYVLDFSIVLLFI